MMHRTFFDGFRDAERRLIFVADISGGPPDMGMDHFGIPRKPEVTDESAVDDADAQDRSRIDDAQGAVDTVSDQVARDAGTAAPEGTTPAPERSPEVKEAIALMESIIGKETTAALTAEIEKNPEIAKSMQALLGAIDGYTPRIQREAAIKSVAYIAEHGPQGMDLDNPEIVQWVEFATKELTDSQREAAVILAKAIGAGEGGQESGQSGYSEEQKAEMIKSAEAAMKGVDLAAMKPGEREGKIGQIMMSTGVTVVEENGKFVAQAPSSKWEMLMNRVMGFATFMGSFITKIRSAFDKASGKATETEQAPTETAEKTAAKVRIDQKLKEGKTLPELRDEAVANKAGAEKEIEELKLQLKTAEDAADAAGKKLKSLTDLRAVDTNSDDENIRLDGEIREAQKVKKAADETLKSVKEKVDAATKKLSDAEMDLVVITEKENAVPKDIPTEPAPPSGEPEDGNGTHLPVDPVQGGNSVSAEDRQDEPISSPEQRFQIALEDTIKVIQDKIRTAQASADNAQKNISQRSWGEMFESIGALGGVLWETVQEKEDRQFADIQRLQKNLDECLAQLNQLRGQDVERGMIALKNMRKSLGLAELPQQLIGDYDLFERKVGEAIDARSGNFFEKNESVTESSTDSFGERVVSDADRVDIWMEKQKNAARSWSGNLAFSQDDQEFLKEIIPENAVLVDGMYEMDVGGEKWTLQRTGSSALLFSRKDNPQISIMLDAQEIVGVPSEWAHNAMQNYNQQEQDPAGLSLKFEIAGENEPMAYIDLTDLSDELIRSEMTTARGFPEILSRRYRLYSTKEDEMDLSKSQEPMMEVRRRIRSYHERGMKNFYINIHAHGSEEGMHFGNVRITPSQMIDLFMEFPDCRFTLNTIACYGGGMGDAMKKFMDHNAAAEHRISVFTQTKGDVINYANGDSQIGHSSAYSAALAEMLMQGVDGRPGKKLTYGEAHVVADRIAKEQKGTDAEAHLSRPAESSVWTANTDHASGSSNIA